MRRADDAADLVAAFDFLARDEPCLNRDVDQSREPSLVVAHPQILARRENFGLIAVSGRCVQCPPNREHPALPVSVEHGLVFLVMGRAHVLHTAHIMNTIHVEDSSAGFVTLAVPIIESRLTHAASVSSLNPALSGGRSGSTR